MKSRWENLAVGDTRSFEVVITDHMIDEFAHISGDKNPLHMDEGFAKEKGFNGRVVHGMLLASMFSRLFGEDFLAEDNLYLSQTINWKRPAYSGDKVIVSGKIESKIESTKTLEIKVSIKDDKGEELVSGKGVVKSLK